MNPRVVVIFNRDFEGADADPENRAREDIKDIADQIIGILNAKGYTATGLGITGDLTEALTVLKQDPPDAVFNLCESVQGDNRFEPLMPMLLDLAGIAYTGSGPLALMSALHKHKAKETLQAHGISTPGAVLLRTPDVSEVVLPFPLIVKPAREDASVGVYSHSVVRDAKSLAARVKHILSHYQQPALVEQYIEGREIYVSMLGRKRGRPQTFPFFEIDFSDLPAECPRIVSFEAKWLEDSPEYHGTRPVRCKGLGPELEDRIAETALTAFEAMELRDYARVDIRLSDDGTPYIIDVNPNCDLSDQAGGFSRAAKAAGLSYEEVILRVTQLALSRRQNADTIPLAARSRRASGNSESSRELSSRGSVVRARAPRGSAR